VIRQIIPHSCEQAGTLIDHRNITAKYVSHIMSAGVEEDINMGIKKLRKTKLVTTSAMARLGVPRKTF
jgi:hypothetical protein